MSIVIDARSGQRRLRAGITDCSATGLRLETLTPLLVGQRFWIKLPGLEAQEIEVMRVDRFSSGCRFVRELDPRVFKAMLWNMKGSEAQAPIDRRRVTRLI